jgi:hypothetical protein
VLANHQTITSIDRPTLAQARHARDAWIGLQMTRGLMADNIIPFDKYHNIKKRLPGFGTPPFENAYAEARALLHAAEGNFLKCAQLTHLGSKLSPLASSILREMVKDLQSRTGWRRA